MNRREGIRAAVGVLLLAAAALLIYESQVGSPGLTVTGACGLPMTVIAPPAGYGESAVVGFHGLSGNRRTLLTLGQQLSRLGLTVYLVDLPGHGDSTKPYSFGRAEQCAAATLELLAQRGGILPDQTVLLGHSMGAAIAARLADRFPTVATIALSPPPLVRPRRVPANLLVVGAQFDLPPFKEQARELIGAAGGERTGTEDYGQRRAAHLVAIPWATHVSLLLDRRAWRVSRNWIQKVPNIRTSRVGPNGSAASASAIGLVGMVLIFPLVASVVVAVLRAGQQKTAATPSLAAPALLLRWVLAALFAVSVLNLWVPLRTLHMLTGDYLASFFLLTGIALLVLLARQAREALRFDAWAIAAAGALAMLAVLALGRWLNWQLADTWPNATRWLRFLPLVLAVWPYFAAEEVALGPPMHKQGWRRWGIFLALRLEIWLALVFAVVAYLSGQALVVMMALTFLVVALLQRAGADMVWRRTGSPSAAAVFDAILAAWFIAAVFPLV